MNTLALISAVYLSIGFAKWVLDMSRLTLFARAMDLIADQYDAPRLPAWKKWGLAAVVITGQCLLCWPQILLAVGPIEFVQPVRVERIAESFALEMNRLT